jgi:plastocyanin
MRLRYLLVLAFLLAACGIGTSETTQSAPTTPADVTTTTTAKSTTTNIATTTTAEATTSTSAPANVIRVEGGVKVEGPDTISVTQGEVVRFQVVADVADEVHVHGYDLFFETVPGEALIVEFNADATGIFEVELEGGHLELVNIEVTP